MKRLMIFLFTFLISCGIFAQDKVAISSLPAASSIGTPDLFVIVQSGTTKKLDYQYLEDFIQAIIHDTSNVLRVEWRGDIHDTADVLRIEIAAAATADTAWQRVSSTVTALEIITDSVGIGTITPTEKVEIVGVIKATSADFDNGYDNLLIGEDAGVNLTSAAAENIYIGNGAGENATSGDYNTAVGFEAGQDITTGTNNVLLGRRAGLNVTEGTANIMLGTLAGAPITTGELNIIIGDGAGVLCSSSSRENIWIGRLAGYDADINNSIFIGSYAGYNADEPGLIGIGYEALEDATSSVGTMAIGYQAGTNITTSDYHTIVGYQAGDAITTGSAGSSLYGYQAGTDMTTADGSSFFGYLAGANVTTGNHNSFFGYEAGDGKTSQNANSAFGYQALSGAVGGTYNSVFGYQAGLAVTGDYNVLIGDGAGKSLVGDSYNTFVGSLAGEDNTGEFNTFVGARSGWNQTSGNANVGLGYGAGGNNNTVGSVYLGFLAGYDNTADSVLFIDNTLTSTPLIWGDFTEDSLIINGDLRVTGYSGGAQAWTDESDRELKENIEPIQNPLNKVMQLEGVAFDWKDDRRGRSIGFIAQDVATVIPELVNAGNPYTMQTSQVTAVLVEAVQEQQRQIRVMWVFIVVMSLAIVSLFIHKSRIKYLSTE